MKINFAELTGTTSGFPILHLSFKFSKRVEDAYLHGNQIPYFRPKEN